MGLKKQGKKVYNHRDVRGVCPIIFFVSVKRKKKGGDFLNTIIDWEKKGDLISTQPFQSRRVFFSQKERGKERENQDHCSNCKLINKGKGKKKKLGLSVQSE